MKRRPNRPSPEPRPQREARPALFALHAAAGEPGGASPVTTRVAWALALVLAGVLLAVSLLARPTGDYFTETDFYGQFAEGARLVQSGHLVPSRYGAAGPVYEVALALVGLLVRDLFRAAQLLSALAAGAAFLLLFGLLKRRASAGLGLAAALFLAFDPTFFRSGCSATTDAPALALQVAALYAVLAGARGRSALAGGALAALACLTRYEGVVLVPAALAALLAGATPRGARVRPALLFAGGFAALALPWLAFSLAHGAGIAAQPQFRASWDGLGHDAPATLARLARDAGEHLRLDAKGLLGGAAAICAIVGLALGLGDSTLRRLWPLALAWALGFLALVPAPYAERSSLVLLPFYATLAGMAFASPLFALALGRGPRVWLKPVLAAAPLGLMALAAWNAQLWILNQLPVEVLQCADALRPLRLPGDGVIARKPNLAFHAGVRAVAFPTTRGLPALADYARRSGSRWLFFSWAELETRPQYSFLLDTTSHVPGLIVRRVIRGHPAVLYQAAPGFGTVPAWMSSDTLRALHALRGRLRVYRDDVKVLLNLGRVEHARGHLGAARGVLERAEQIAPDNMQVLVELGTVTLLQRDARASEAVFSHAQSVSPESFEARLGRGWAKLMLGKPKEAALFWRPLVPTTRDPVTLERMAGLFHDLGDREAEATARASLRAATAGRQAPPRPAR